SLLRARRERPHCREAEQREEVAASHHSITSSARCWSIQGTSRPSALAVLRLSTRSYLAGACTGRSAGAVQDAIDITRRAPPLFEPVNSVGQQAAEFSEVTVRINGRETIASSQRCDLRAMDDQVRIRRHDQATIRLASMSGNDRFKLGSIVNGRRD